MSTAAKKLTAQNISFAYSPTAENVITDLSITIEPGTFVGLLGPNGAGKSTLLRLLAAVDKPNNGQVLLGDTPLEAFPKKQLATKIAFVPQDVRIWLPFTCREIVAMGRYAQQKGLTMFARSSDEIVLTAMRDTGVEHLADRAISQVSGGEAQRVRIAQALAQQTGILILDEPTSHLDISFQLEIMDLASRLNKQRKLTVITALHDLNLASLYCQRLVVLKQGQVVGDGDPSQLLTSQLLKQVFRVDADIVPTNPGQGPRVFLKPNSLYV